MKSFVFLVVCTLSVLAFAPTAQSDSWEAKGDFSFDLEGATGDVEFKSDIKPDGSVEGQMTLAATVDVLENPEEATDPVQVNLTIQAGFDCMLVHNDRAAMSGVITAASAPGYVGRQTLLVVAKNVPDIQPSTDAFTWGVYQPNFVNLTATDYDFCPAVDPEGEGDSEFTSSSSPCIVDDGASRTWWASDFELCGAGDGETPSPQCGADPGSFLAGLSTLPPIVDCTSFPLTGYPLNPIPYGDSNHVEVRPNL
jgi:hypothetical protein